MFKNSDGFFPLVVVLIMFDFYHFNLVKKGQCNLTQFAQFLLQKLNRKLFLVIFYLPFCPKLCTNLSSVFMLFSLRVCGKDILQGFVLVFCSNLLLSDCRLR